MKSGEVNQKNIRRYFEKECEDFDAYYRSAGNLKDVIRRASYPFTKKAIVGRVTALVDLIGDGIKGLKVLEVGCGPGDYSIKIAAKGAVVTSVDYAQGMIDIARRNAEKAGVSIEFKKGDFLTMDIPGSFEYVFATGVMDYVDPAQHKDFLKKMADLSDRFVVVSFPKRWALHAAIRSVWLGISKKIKISFFTEKEVARLAEACGLKEADRRDVGILWVIKFEKI